MSGLFFPILLTVAALAAAIATYRGIRRGGARFYTLERETLLRQASMTLMFSVLLFLTVIGMLLYERQQAEVDLETAAIDVMVEEPTPTATPDIDQILSPAEEPTPDPQTPTPTATALICRGMVEGTFDNGLKLRTTPNGEEIQVLAEASIVTVLTEEEPVQQAGYTWRKVRSIFGDEGWVADQFLTLGSGCE